MPKCNTLNLTTALLFALCLGAVGFGRDDKAAKDKAPEAAKPDFTTDAATWFAEFKKDKKAAQDKYKGKLIELTGEVDTVSEDPFAEVGYVYLKIEGDILGVRCATVDKKPWVKVSPGSKVTVRGKPSEIIAGPDLNKVEIVAAGKNPGVAIAAEALAKEFVANRKETKTKYDDKWAYVEGEVLDKTESKFCPALLKVKGADDVVLNCCFGEPGKKAAQPIKVGAKIKVFGRLAIYDNADDKVLYLNSCALTEAK